MPPCKRRGARQHEREIVGQLEARLRSCRRRRATRRRRRRCRLVSVGTQGVQSESGVEGVEAEAFVQADEELGRRIDIGFRNGTAGELFLGCARQRPEPGIGRDEFDDTTDVGDERVAPEVGGSPPIHIAQQVRGIR